MAKKDNVALQEQVGGLDTKVSALMEEVETAIKEAKSVTSPSSTLQRYTKALQNIGGGMPTRRW